MFKVTKTKKESARLAKMAGHSMETRACKCNVVLASSEPMKVIVNSVVKIVVSAMTLRVNVAPAIMDQ